MDIPPKRAVERPAEQSHKRSVRSVERTVERFIEQSKKQNQLLADMHVHLSNTLDQNVLIATLSSPGITGLAIINDGNGGILSYEQALALPHVTETEKGQLAMIETSSGRGYFMRAQEITESKNHILALGFEGSYFQNFSDARIAVEKIHQKGGIAILNHPYITANKDALILKYRLLTKQEEQQMKELTQMVDEIEIFNAQCINPTFGIIIPNMNKANERAQQLALERGFHGVAASDTHFRPEQVKRAGIYIAEKDLSIDGIKEAIKNGNFSNTHRTYVDRWSFLRGMFG